MIVICIVYCITTPFFHHFQIFYHIKNSLQKEGCRYLLRK
ncbi:hypothetical protein EFW58_02259 [Bacillus velezensis]|nr:hypothetical protein EFW58_02259 [Bacillus velezensis]